MHSARLKLRTMLASGCTSTAPVFDSLSARIAEVQGWPICHLSGSVAKFADLAVPDGVPLSNMSDLVDVCRRVLRAANVCLMVDADDGGGNAVNVMRTVRELEATGVAGIEIEDNAVPKVLGGAEARHSFIASIEEYVGKLDAALAARQDPSTVIVARTSALAELPLNDALDRIRAYSQTGADLLMVYHLTDHRAQLAAASRATHLPLGVVGLPADLARDQAFLEANRIRVRFMPGQLTYSVAVKAIYDCLDHLRHDRPRTELASHEAGRDLFHLIDRTDAVLGWQKRYVKA